MLDNFQKELEEINKIQYSFVKKVLRDIWRQDLDDWSIDINMYGTVSLNDIFFEFNDLVMVAKYNIDYDVVMEWYDIVSLTHQTKRVKEAIKKDKDFKNINLYMFARYFDNK